MVLADLHQNSSVAQVWWNGPAHCIPSNHWRDHELLSIRCFVPPGRKVSVTKVFDDLHHMCRDRLDGDVFCQEIKKVGWAAVLDYVNFVILLQLATHLRNVASIVGDEGSHSHVEVILTFFYLVLRKRLQVSWCCEFPDVSNVETRACWPFAFVIVRQTIGSLCTFDHPSNPIVTVSPLNLALHASNNESYVVSSSGPPNILADGGLYPGRMVSQSLINSGWSAWANGVFVA